MKIIGVDPGSAITGYAVIKRESAKDHKFKALDFGCIVTDQYLPAGERLKKIHKDLGKIIEKHKPDIISVESLYFFKNLKTVMPVSQARGVILLTAAEKRVPVIEFTPLQVKMAIVGYGRAEKKQIKEMMKYLIDIDGFDLKKNFRKKDDAIDAIGIAICAGLKSF